MTFSYKTKNFNGCNDGNIYYKGNLIKKIYFNKYEIYQKYNHTYHKDIRSCPSYHSDSFDVWVNLSLNQNVSGSALYWKGTWLATRVGSASASVSTNGSSSVSVSVCNTSGNTVGNNDSSGSGSTSASTGSVTAIEFGTKVFSSSASATASRSYTFGDGHTATISTSTSTSTSGANSNSSSSSNSNSCSYSWTTYYNVDCSYYTWDPA